MKLYRVSALVERDMRKFFRSPALMLSSLLFPLVQLVVLGYAFGGKIKNADIAFVDEDHSVQSRRIEEMFDGIKAGPQTFRVVPYDSFPRAVDDLHAGFVKAVVDVPHDFSRRYYQHDRPRLVFTEDNTDQFISSSLLAGVQDMTTELNTPDVASSRLDGQVELNVVEVYPYIEYIKYLLAGSIAMGIFITAMIGGGITYIDDKTRGLSSDAHSKVGVGRGTHRLGNSEGVHGGNVVNDYRRVNRGHLGTLAPVATLVSLDCPPGGVVSDD